MIFSHRHFIFVIGLITLSMSAQAQVRCATVEVEKIRRQKNSQLESSEQFEQWMKGMVSRIKSQSLSNNRQEGITYTIPVVVHVINNGENIGNGSNISVAQIQSQIDVLNKDYPRLNVDTTKTLSGFKPVAGYIDINFVLAKQDPEGQPTTGIVRVKGSKASWQPSENNLLKAQSFWPSEDYLNIWVVNLVDPNGTIGFAQLPVSNLAGLNNITNDRLTDGVVIHYRAFGSGNFNLFGEFSKGRTATHEIGHFLGLRHIWGDDGSACTGSDYCNDTPNQGGFTSGGKTGIVADNCSASIMYQNYMDYTNDTSMNIFTQDQVARMVVVLANSPRRVSLTTSHGALDPTVVANDLGIKRISSPLSAACSSISPSIVVRNYGSNAITSSQIQLTINGSVVQTNSVVFNPSLNPLDSVIVNFNPLSLSAGNTYNIGYQVSTVNGVADGKAYNNSLLSSITIPTNATLPFFEGFTTSPPGWSIVNPDGLTTWTLASAANGSPSNQAMYMDYYNYQNQGETDQLITPSFDLTNEAVALLKFDRSYTTASGSELDRLQVVVSTGCGFSATYQLFNKAGTALATSPANGGPYTPTSASQWITETIPLTQFLGQSNVRIAFIGTNDWGNNLYIDNVQVINGSYDDLTLEGVSRPSPVTCLTTPTPVITVRNSGTRDITSFQVQISIGTGGPSSQSFSGFTLQAGQTQDFTLNNWTLQDGTNNVTITANLANDVQPSDNSTVYKVVVNSTQETPPLRENLDSNFPEWTIVSQGQNMKWTATATSKNISLEYNAFNNPALGSNSWFVSPMLDFTKVPKASLFYDLSYAKGTLRGAERLQVLASTNCGYTYNISLFDKLGDQFSNSSTSSSWIPNDWSRIYINLDTLVGQTQTRIAFVVTNNNGNNLFLDNIEIFGNDDPNPTDLSTLDLDHLVYYNADRTDPRITFNLTEKQTVNMKIINPMGQVVSDLELADMLNQTYHLDLGGKPGIYILRIQIGNQLASTKVFIPN